MATLRSELPKHIYEALTKLLTAYRYEIVADRVLYFHLEAGNRSKSHLTAELHLH
jgi:hypothetical protein